MKQLQVTLPREFKDDARELLEDYSSDVSVSEAEKNDEKVVEFHVTAKSDQIDELSQELKDIEGLESGDLTVNVMKQESQIKKGSKIKGENSILSQAEIYSRAQEAAVFNRAEWGLVALSAVIATLGLVEDNIIVIVGAMMVAPILSPFISGALSLNVGDKSLLKQSLKTGSSSFLLAVIASAIAAVPFPVTMNPSITLVSEPSIISVLLSLFVGAAAALTFMTGMKDEIAGVAVAIALIPPISSIGIGLKTADISLVASSISVASMNIFSVIISGFASFYLLGVSPSTYYREKQAEKLKYVVPATFLVFSVIAIPVVNFSLGEYQVSNTQAEIEDFGESYFGSDLLTTRFENDRALFYVIGDYNETLFRDNTPSEANISVKVLERPN